MPQISIHPSGFEPLTFGSVDRLELSQEAYKSQGNAAIYGIFSICCVLVYSRDSREVAPFLGVYSRKYPHVPPLFLAENCPCNLGFYVGPGIEASKAKERKQV